MELQIHLYFKISVQLKKQRRETNLVSRRCFLLSITLAADDCLNERPKNSYKYCYRAK